MSRGNEIIVTANPRGVFDEGFVKSGQTFQPGMIVQRDPTVALKGNRFTYKLADIAADGALPVGPIAVVRENNLVGKTLSDTYAAGDRTYVYFPLQGEELNVLLKDPGATTNAGVQLVVDDGTGLVQAAAGTEVTAPFQTMESLADPSGNALIWSQFTGY